MDALLAGALRRGAPPEALQWSPDESALAVARTQWHGIAGLLAGQRQWPDDYLAAVRAEAMARAMWELRHRQLLAPVLARLAEEGTRVLLLKGTALAYDLYDEPAQRARGDTDLWTDTSGLERVRAVLKEAGFRPVGSGEQPPALALQEDWIHDRDGALHAVDLHRTAINSLSLAGLFDFEACWERRRSLDRLGRGAWSLSHGDALLHTAVHREMHVAAPYRVAGVDHHGGDRLIWAMDVALLAEALGSEGLALAVEEGRRLGLERALGRSLTAARDWLHIDLPENLPGDLERSDPTPASRYLEAGRLARAWRDLGRIRSKRERIAALRSKLSPEGAGVVSRLRRIAGLLGAAHGFRR